MKRPHFSNVLALTGCTGLAVLLYNSWSFGCGRCSLQTFLTLGPPGLALLAANASALAVLLGLRLRRLRRGVEGCCRCGTALIEDWCFCPDCGRPAGSSN